MKDDRPTTPNRREGEEPTYRSRSSDSIPKVVAPDATKFSEVPGSQRYDDVRLLGEGGMGEVRLCKDNRIGREVARKVMRPEMGALSDGLQRFVREARVQGQLEHPVVVPVYDVGEENGCAFFTMKRVRGQTLSEVLRSVRHHDEDAADHFTRRRLLSAFSQICLAVDFAHSRGVLHRDLKPANVMLGDFGEVHLLDWGLARTQTSEDAPHATPVTNAPAGTTLAGEVMGTPGYMAPEQAQGTNHLLSPVTDVYALGAILFEILTLEPLHRGTTADSRIVSTLALRDARPLARNPELDIPPELDALVASACAFDPTDRLPSARALSEALERYLDGDRDQERRKQLAQVHVASARASMQRESSRADAMREVTKALALAPDEPEALKILGQLLTEVPSELPAAAQLQMEAAQAKARSGVVGVAATRAMTWMAFVPLVAWMGVRDWRLASFTLGALGLSLAAAIALKFGGNAVTNRASIGLLLLSSLALAGIGFVLSPFVLVPALAATNTLFFATYLSRRARPLAALAGVVAVLAPLALEAIGVLSPSFLFRAGDFVLLPRMTDLPPTPTLVWLVVGSVALVVTPAVLVGRLRDSLAEAEKKLFLHAWHLRALAPTASNPP